MTNEVRKAVLNEIESLHKQEQKAFVGGDCEKLMSFYDEYGTFYTGGRIRTQEERLNFCEQIPRPFRDPNGDKPKIDDRFYVLSETSAYIVRTIDFKPERNESSTFKREVVTKIWSKTSAGWKIVHFHASTHTVSSI